MANWVGVAAALDLTHGSMITEMLQGKKIVFANYSGKIYALGAICPHAAGPLNRGRLVGGDFVCSGHGARFSVKDGTPITGPTQDLATRYEVVAEGNEIFVDIPIA